jgi:MoxR-like ATPase/xanthine/CO dehydrogenase XdhC/CoxF family maturation factor
MTNTELLNRADVLRHGRTPFVLATVVHAERPTSARPGDSALVLPDGTVEGFVGGTCAETTVQLQGLRVLETGESLLLRITPAANTGGEGARDPVEGLVTVANPCLSGGTLDIFLEANLPPALAYVYGHAPIARALLDVGRVLGLDARPASPGEPLPPDLDVVVVATHGRDEEKVLIEAARSGVPYIGLVASPKRGAAVLAGLDITDERRARIHTPAGLDIEPHAPRPDPPRRRPWPRTWIPCAACPWRSRPPPSHSTWPPAGCTSAGRGASTPSPTTPPGTRMPDLDALVPDVAALRSRLDAVGYLADDALATALLLAVRMRQPILLEGEPGVGKTEAARALAAVLDTPLIRLQCYEGLSSAEALYEWNYPRQLLAIRLAESRGEPLRDADLFTEDYLLPRPLLAALCHPGPRPAVLLIDEVDRADDEFEAFLLELLADAAVTIPELGTRTAVVPPVAVLTSNRTRDLHDALKRRCLYHWIDYPDTARVAAIIRRRLPESARWLAAQVARGVARLRARQELTKPPGIAEAIDWAGALHALGLSVLDADAADRTLGVVLKYAEDLQAVRRAGLAELVDAEAGSGSDA